MSTSRRRLSALVAGYLALGLAACANPVERLTENVIEQQAGADIESGDDSYVVTSEDGSTFGTGKNLPVPETWPSELPLPKGRIVMVQAIANAWTLQYEDVTRDDYDAVVGQLEGFTEVNSLYGEGLETRGVENDFFTYTITYSEVNESGPIIQLSAVRKD